MSGTFGQHIFSVPRVPQVKENAMFANDTSQSTAKSIVPTEKCGRTQSVFNVLQVNIGGEELEHLQPVSSSLTGSSSFGSFSGSFSSINSEALGSISGILSHSMASALTFSSDLDSVGMGHKESKLVTLQQKIDGPKQYKRSRDENSSSTGENPSSIDFDWLLDRCGGDNHLVDFVLQSFADQGRQHIESLQSFRIDGDKQKLSFHAACICFSAFLS
jgi:hypothetical protein